MGKPDLNRQIIEGEELRTKMDNGVEKLYSVALTAYGARGGNVMIEHRASAPTISHDGVTNLEELEVTDAVEDMTIKVIKQASQRTNQTAGDGTTLSAILSRHLYRWAMDKIVAGQSPAKVSKQIMDNANDIVEEVKKMTIQKPSNKLLKGACIISAGDEALGEMIYDIVSEVGEYGGINVSYVGSLGIRSEITKGMYLSSGYTDPKLINDLENNRSVLEDTPVVIISNTITRQDEIIPILDHLKTSNFNRACFFADITGDALKVLEMNRIFDATVVKPEATNYEVLLKDVALYTGGLVFSGNPAEWTLKEYGGFADSITVGQRETTIVGGHSDKDKLKAVLSTLKANLSKAEPQDRPFLETRLARLSASVATIYVGGASAVERGEVKLRVDDAVCAAKSALVSGVVPGGGVCLRDVGRKLNLPYLKKPEYDLARVSGIVSDPIGSDDKWSDHLMEGSGYNLITHNVDILVDKCIVDPSLVIQEAVINSHSVIAKLITTQKALSFEDREWKF